MKSEASVPEGLTERLCESGGGSVAEGLSDRPGGRACALNAVAGSSANSGNLSKHHTGIRSLRRTLHRIWSARTGRPSAAAIPLRQWLAEGLPPPLPLSSLYCSQMVSRETPYCTPGWPDRMTITSCLWICSIRFQDQCTKLRSGYRIN